MEFLLGSIPIRRLAQHATEVGYEAMLFLSFEDTTALYETVLFPKAYRKLAPLTLTRGPYLVEGTVRVEHDNFVVDVQNLQLLGQA